MQTIIAIGGGELAEKETLAIDREIVRLAEKDRPRALFLPTASGEPQGYVDAFDAVYGGLLGCRTDVLRILTEEASDTMIADKILSADIVYVGGGNTRRMLEAWRLRGVDRLLEEAWRQGTILSGLSAGSVCWFDSGYSDSDLDVHGEYVALRALGLFPGIHCPHYEQRPEFDRYIKSYGGCGIGLEGCCALVVRDGQYRTLESAPDASAYLLQGFGGRLIRERLNRTDWAPLSWQAAR